MLSRLRNMFRVPDLRNKILFTIFDHRGLPARRAPAGPVRQLQRDQGPAGPGERTAASSASSTSSPAARSPTCRSSSSGSCRTSRRRSSCSCCRWSSRSSSSGSRRARSGRRRSRSGPATSPSAWRIIQSTGFVFALHQGKGGLLGFAGFHGHRHDPELQRGQGRAHRAHLDGRHRLVMWLGELITQRGIGNGMSILIFASVVSRLPAQGSRDLHRGQRSSQFFTILAHRRRR